MAGHTVNIPAVRDTVLYLQEVLTQFIKKLAIQIGLRLIGQTVVVMQNLMFNIYTVLIDI